MCATKVLVTENKIVVSRNHDRMIFHQNQAAYHKHGVGDEQHGRHENIRCGQNQGYEYQAGEQIVEGECEKRAPARLTVPQDGRHRRLAKVFLDQSFGEREPLPIVGACLLNKKSEHQTRSSACRKSSED